MKCTKLVGAMNVSLTSHMHPFFPSVIRVTTPILLKFVAQKGQDTNLPTILR